MTAIGKPETYDRVFGQRSKHFDKENGGVWYQIIFERINGASAYF